MSLASALSFLTGLFLGLRLGNVVTWSYWWVFSPVWIPVLAMFLLFAFGISVAIIDERSKSKFKVLPPTSNAERVR